MPLTRRHWLLSTVALPLNRAASAPARPRRIRIGQIGSQHGHAAGKMETLRRLTDDFEVAGLADGDDSDAPAFRDVPRMDAAALLSLPGLEAVVVETDFPDACAAAHAAIKAGKHVHLDKPGALDHAAFRKMRTEAEQRGLIFQMGYMLRYNPAIQLMHRAVSEGWLGTVTGIDAMIGKKLDAAGRQSLLQLAGGGMFELGCHLVDTVCWMLGKPVAVQSLAKPTGTDGFKDNQLALLEFSGSVAALRCNMADPFGFPRRRFQVTGTEGSMEVIPLESGRITAGFTAAHGEFKSGEQQVSLAVPAGRYDAELISFAEAVRSGKPLPWSAAHDIAVHETALRAGGVVV